MDTFTPLFSKIVNSSIWTEPYYVRVLWLTMLAVQDSDHVVRYSAFSLAQAGKMTEGEVLEGLKILSEPDTKRIEPQEHEGRRIEKVEDGWLILSGEKYQKMMQTIFHRARNREAMRERRRMEKVEPLRNPRTGRVEGLRQRVERLGRETIEAEKKDGRAAAGYDVKHGGHIMEEPEALPEDGQGSEGQEAI